MELNNKFNWQDIDGWFNFSRIYDQMIREANRNDSIIEVGWPGRSTCYLATRAKMSGKNIKIVSIDTNQNSNLAEFNKQITQIGVVDYIKTISMNSEIASYNTISESIFGIFIDVTDINKEIQNWYQKIKPGGILAGHSIHSPNTHQILQETFKKLKATNIEEFDDIWMVRKTYQ